MSSISSVNTSPLMPQNNGSLEIKAESQPSVESCSSIHQTDPVQMEVEELIMNIAEQLLGKYIDIPLTPEGVKVIMEDVLQEISNAFEQLDEGSQNELATYVASTIVQKKILMSPDGDELEYADSIDEEIPAGILDFENKA